MFINNLEQQQLHFFHLTHGMNNTKKLMNVLRVNHYKYVLIQMTMGFLLTLSAETVWPQVVKAIGLDVINSSAENWVNVLSNSLLHEEVCYSFYGVCMFVLFRLVLFPPRFSGLCDWRFSLPLFSLFS